MKQAIFSKNLGNQALELVVRSEEMNPCLLISLIETHSCQVLRIRRETHGFVIIN